MKSDRKLMRAAAAFLLGILLARQRNVLWLIPTALLFGWLYLLEYGAGRRRRGILRCLCLTGILLAGAIRYEAAAKHLEKYEGVLSEGGEVLLAGQIYQKESKNQNQIYYLKHSCIYRDQETIPLHKTLLYLDSDEFSVGETLVVRATGGSMAEPRNFGNFDQKRYYRSRKIDAIYYGKAVKKRVKTDLPVERLLWELRQRFRTVYLLCAPERDAGVLCTMLLGDRTTLDTELKELYQSSGISHILAISGLHISLIGMGLYRLLKRCGAGVVCSGIISGGVMVLYTVMTGLSPSAIRACLMFLAAMLAPMLKRSYDSLSALSLAALLLLVENPFLTEYSGFVFSFAAVLAVVVFVRPLTDVHMKKIPAALLSSAVIQLVTLPIVMWEYYEIPLYASFLNLLILPLVGVLLACGLLGGLLGVAGLIFPARIILFIPHLILLFYEKMCKLTAELPGAALITGKPAGWMLVCYYAVLIFAFFLVAAWKKKGAALAPALLLTAWLLLPKQRETELCVLDVGQGDGIFLSTPQGTAFIDGGSTDVKGVGKYRIEPFLKAKGCRGIDFWLVTHTDQDHINGLAELLEDGYEIRNLVFSRYIPQDEAYDELCTLAEANGTEVLGMAPGEVVRLGDASLQCIFPDENYPGSDKNALSLVTLFTQGNFSALLTGDISAEEERYLLQSTERSGIERISFYKAAHHGSKYSNSADYLQVLSPEAAAISCGAGNRYGHPAEEAVKSMEAAGAVVYDTRYTGQITVTLPQGRMQIETMCGSAR